MSLRCASRFCVKAVQLLRERGSKSMAGFKASSSSQANQTRRFSAAAMEPAKKAGVADERMRRLREVEKAENVVNLICWGPS
ncbi:hypothetical protein QJS04_geneDACA021978 [Acorus gramineus]|uniref:Uncharacterized protein n=1 Tax=Acorus gramineus TaxID=55184 RepID=A0AAV9A978_ACOGR|nr:hypothetical protein QJS04_geneDACA021978 [Acorus gramineus]